MIPYVEIIGKYDQKPFAVVEPSQCWFELSYYDIGECEVYASATPKNLQALRGGNYVKMPNMPYLWVLKSITYTFVEGVKMISAKGYEAKWLIGTRIILSPWTLPANLGEAAFQLVNKNLGSAAASFRKIVGLTVERPQWSDFLQQTQATRGNLWEFLSALLRANGCGTISQFSNGIRIRFIQGRDRSEEVLFAQSLDNLLSTEYVYDSSDLKTYAQIVSEFSEKDEDGNEVKNFYASQYPKDDPTPTPKKNVGVDRAEIYIASNVDNKALDENGNPIIDPQTGKEIVYPPTSEEFKNLQRQEGRNALAEHKVLKHFSGEIDLRFSPYRFGEDFFIGDLIGIRDETLGYQEKARVLKYTFKQDSGGYGEEAEYESEE